MSGRRDEQFIEGRAGGGGSRTYGGNPQKGGGDDSVSNTTIIVISVIGGVAVIGLSALIFVNDVLPWWQRRKLAVQ